MEICGKCGREPWDGICNLLSEPHVTNVVKPRKNQYTKANCGHPLIGESPLIIEAAERNLEIREDMAREVKFNSKFDVRGDVFYLKGTNTPIGFKYRPSEGLSREVIEAKLYYGKPD